MNESLFKYRRYDNGRFREIEGALAQERPITITLNRQELVTINCTPLNLTALAVGFLYHEGFIDSADEIGTLRVCEDEQVVEVQLAKGEVVIAPRKRVITSGCGGGTSFSSLVEASDLKPIISSASLSSSQIFALMKTLFSLSTLHQTIGGVHSSGLTDGQEFLIVAEDFGRHNTLDKIAGEALLKGLATEDRFIFTSGRISSEMVLKATRMETPILVSQTACTNMAIELAKELGLTLVGYVRAGRMDIYSFPERITES